VTCGDVSQPRVSVSVGRRLACRDAFEWQLISGVAREVAVERGVPVESLNAVALVPLVQGEWSTSVGSGAVLCSAAAAQDPSTARAVLRTAFASGIH